MIFYLFTLLFFYHILYKKNINLTIYILIQNIGRRVNLAKYIFLMDSYDILRLGKKMLSEEKKSVEINVCDDTN